ncbi:MAG: hypothetical protein ACKV2U_17035 [Bryobacteraceae bacterium]
MFKRTLITVVLAAATAVSTLADDRRDRGGSQDYGNDRYSYGTNNNGRYNRVDPVSGTLRDLRYVWSRNRVDNHEADHFRRASEALDRFQQQASRGRFDRNQLDRAIDNLGDLAQAHQIHPRDRQLLRSRLYELRSFRNDGSRYRY